MTVHIMMNDTPEQIKEKVDMAFKPMEAMSVAWVHVFEDHDVEPQTGCHLCEREDA